MAAPSSIYSSTAALPTNNDTHFYAPCAIETASGVPVVLELLPDTLTNAEVPVSVVRIDGQAIDSLQPTALPGIRVGSGEGCGFIFRRVLDGQLVFAPDENYRGVASFSCTIATAIGEEATFITAVNVRPETDAVEIGFVDGSTRLSVQEGVSSVILGALRLTGVDGENVEISVFEGGSDKPSERFAVVGDKLCLTKPLDHAADEAIQLRVLVSDGLRELGESGILIEVSQSDEANVELGQDQVLFAAGTGRWVDEWLPDYSGPYAVSIFDDLPALSLEPVPHDVGLLPDDQAGSDGALPTSSGELFGE